MKRITLISLASLMFLSVMSASAAAADKANVMRIYDDSVAPAQVGAYEAGIKAFNKCMHDHGFKYRFTALNHQTGGTYEMSYVSDLVTWADFDKMHEQGKPCGATWRSAVDPHLQSEDSAFAVDMPELSHTSKGVDMGHGLYSVTALKLKPGHKNYETFTADAKKFAEAANKTNWPGHWNMLAIQAAGPGAPSFLLVSQATSWADFGREMNPPFWKMVEKVYGKTRTNRMRADLDRVIAKASSHVDSYNADLSYIPAK